MLANLVIALRQGEGKGEGEGFPPLTGGCRPPRMTYWEALANLVIARRQKVSSPNRDSVDLCRMTYWEALKERNLPFPSLTERIGEH